MRLSISTVVQQAVAPRGGIAHLVPAGPFLPAHGRVLTPLNWDATCQSASRGPQRCEAWAIFARLPSGTRLVAAAHGLTLYDQRDRPKGVAAPYRVSFVVP